MENYLKKMEKTKMVTIKNVLTYHLSHESRASFGPIWLD